MKNAGVMLVVVLLVVCGSVAQAAVQNPETFETYSTTPNFENVANTGWFEFGGDAAAEYHIVTGKNLKMVDGGGGKAAARWGAYLDKTTTPRQLLSMDFYLVSGSTAGVRASIQMDDVDGVDSNARYWHNPGNVVIGSTLGTATLTANGGTAVSLEGAANLAEDTWYTLEMDHDWTNTRIRARYGPQGGTMNDWTAWQTWGGNYSNQQCKSVKLTVDQGTCTTHFDNMSLTAVPEPASAGLLLLGAVALLRRRKK